MKVRCCLITVAALACALFLSGCSLRIVTRKLPVPKAPSIEQTVTPEALVEKLNQRWAALGSLNASVEISASVLKTKEGTAKDYPTIRGIILMLKPEMLRVYGRVPVLGTRFFDMVGDGSNFTLWIPSSNTAFKGSEALTKKSSNPLLNLRPGFFRDALVVRGLEKGDEYMVTADTVTVEDALRKHLYSVPEYKLTIMRRRAGSPLLTPVRVITFHRDDLLPYAQDLYDADGNLETQVTYSNYQDSGSTKYPATVSIQRPMDEFGAVLTVDEVTENPQSPPLTSDSFELKIAEGTKIQHLE
ncbi:MAG: hypothetical protein WAN35_14445 [Terracidiphilus sp.]